MNKPATITYTALCSLILLAGQASAGALGALEALSASRPANYGKIFDNTREAVGGADTRTVTQPQLKRMMLEDLDSLRNMISARYAPAGWKKELLGWDLDEEIRKAKDAVNASGTASVKDYQKTVKKLFASMQDYHVSVSFHSTEAAFLPFSVTESGGRYYISAINRKALPEDTFPFHIGDELTAFDGKGTAAAIAGFQAQAGMNNVPGTDRALAAAQLTFRSGSSGSEVPRGPVLIGVRPAGSQAEVPYQMNWGYAPELIPPQPFLSKRAGRPQFPMSWLAIMMADPFAGAGPLAAGNPYALGDKNGFLPDLGEKTWEAPEGSLFRAYVYRSPVNGRNIGYIRINSYSVEAPDESVKDFAKLVAELEQRSDALVIDQGNNPGGIVFYLYALTSMLTDAPLTLPKHRVTLTPSDISEAVDFIKETAQIKTDEDAQKAMGLTVAGYPVSYKLVASMAGFYKTVIQQWGAGKTLTDPLPAFGLETIEPAAGARYTKPIMILTNALDFSGGDFFPAIMQDNRRAVTFGERTAGAGGVIKSYNYQNSLLGMREFNLTATIAERPGGQPIESLGVKPDIPCPMQPEDFQTGFAGYIKAVNAAAAGL